VVAAFSLQEFYFGRTCCARFFSVNSQTLARIFLFVVFNILIGAGYNIFERKFDSKCKQALSIVA
jgi:hypothetical protein